jgi:hypothetical protein
LVVIGAHCAFGVCVASMERNGNGKAVGLH